MVFVFRSLHQGAYVAVFKRPFGPEGDFDGLFAIVRRRGARVAILGEMDDPEVDLRLDPSGGGSNTVTYGEPEVTVFEPSGVW
jgi:hypothetical protein